MRPRILIVDDEAPIRNVCAASLGSLGWVTVAGSVEEALPLAEEADLVLTDLCMPAGSGLDLAELLRARQPRLPIVLMTSALLEERQAQALDRLGVPVLAKPFNLVDLQGLLRRVLEAGAARVA